MNDTSPEVAQKLLELFEKKTPLERVLMGCSMYDASRMMITQAILRENPNISKPALRREIFLCFYGDDFPAEERERIAKWAEDSTPENWEPFATLQTAQPPSSDGPAPSKSSGSR